MSDALRTDSGFSANVLPPEDDSPSVQAGLGFAIKFFANDVVSQIWVNNNGNLTTQSALSQFTPSGIASSVNQPLIAAFWADVDTRGGPVTTYGQSTIDGHPAFGVSWIEVGYYGQTGSHLDKRNTFQIVLISRSDVATGDFDIELNVGKVQWETGDASQGVGGLGGNSAHMGYTNGLSGSARVSFEMPGSGVNGAFLDTNQTSGLIHNSRNSDVLGRYVFPVRSGVVVGVLPQVPQGRVREVAASGADAPAPTSGSWDVLKGAVIVASEAVSNDWKAAWNGAAHVVQPPPGAPVGTDYKVRSTEAA